MSSNGAAYLMTCAGSFAIILPPRHTISISRHFKPKAASSILTNIKHYLRAAEVLLNMETASCVCHDYSHLPQRTC